MIDPSDEEIRQIVRRVLGRLGEAPSPGADHPGSKDSIQTRALVGEEQALGYAHFAFALGSKERVDTLTQELVRDGYQLLDGPRFTGDGYYESCFFDPDGNRIELTI